MCPMRIYYCSCVCRRQFSFLGQWHGKQRGGIHNTVSVAPSAVVQFPCSWSWSRLQPRKTSALQQSPRQLFHKIFSLLKGFTVTLPQVLSGPHVAGTAFPALGGTENQYAFFFVLFSPGHFSRVLVKLLCGDRKIFYPCWSRSQQHNVSSLT